MSSEVVMGVYGINSDENRLAMIDSLYKSSGVLDVFVSPGDNQVQVKYDGSSLLARDIKKTIEGEGLKVSYIRG